MPVVIVNVQKKLAPDYAKTDIPTWLGELYACGAIGEMVADILKGLMNLEKKENWISKRKGILNPADLSIEERNKLIKENPAYGNIICRCESVTEGEIIDALHRIIPARSLDGVKRRTRAGMGRCQAGFCTPKAIEILARELGISEEDVCKNIPGSEMLTGEVM